MCEIPPRDWKKKTKTERSHQLYIIRPYLLTELEVGENILRSLWYLGSLQVPSKQWKEISKKRKESPMIVMDEPGTNVDV